MLEQRHSHVMEKTFYGSCFDLSLAAEGGLLGVALLSLDSLDQTAHFLLAARNPHGSWPKQVQAHRRKSPLTSTTDHPQAPGEATGMDENGSGSPRALSKVGSNMEPSPPHRPTRDTARLPSGALSSLLETQVQGLFSQAKGRGRNDCLDQRDGDEQPASSVPKGFGEN
jgi:hypothetical protein